MFVGVNVFWKKKTEGEGLLKMGGQNQEEVERGAGYDIRQGAMMSNDQ